MDITDGDGVRLVMGSAAHYNIINGRSDDVITEKGYWGTTAYANEGNTVSVSFPERVLMMRQATSEYPLFAGFNDSFAVTMTKSASTAVSELTADDNAPAAYFDLTGRPVATPAEGGVYIRRQGGTVSKVLIK